MSVFKPGIAALMGAFFLTACGEAPQTTEAPEEAAAAPAVADAAEPTQAAAPAAVADGQSKLVIYRTSFGGFAVQPKVFVNGKEAAVCTPGRATTIPVAPGTYSVTAKTLSEKAVSVSVPEGGTAYVKCSITVGLVVGGAKLVVVPEAEAAPKVAKLKKR